MVTKPWHGKRSEGGGIVVSQDQRGVGSAGSEGVRGAAGATANELRLLATLPVDRKR